MSRWRWTVLMTVAGLTTAGVILAVSGSVWWALAGLLGTGIVANSITSAQAANRRR